MTQPAASPSLSVQTFWLMLAKTIGFGLTVVLPMLLVRLLTQADYGLYKQAFVVVATCSGLLTFGAGLSAFYYLPARPDRHPQIVLNVVVFSLASGGAALLLFSLLPQTLVRLVGSRELLPLAPLVGLVILLSVVSYFLEQIATALQDVKYSTLFIVFAKLSKVAVMTGAVLVSRSVIALLLAAVAQGVLQTGILFWYLHRRFGRFWRGFDLAFFREQIGYVVPFGLYGLLNILQTDLHNYFVANAFGPAVFAVYAVGCLQVPLVGLLRESVTAVLIARVSALHHQDRPREVLELMAAAMRKLTLVYAPAYAFFFVAAREVIVLLYTSAYEESSSIFRINLSLLLLGVVLTDPVVRAYPRLRTYVVVVRSVLVAVLAVALWGGIRAMGMRGALVALVAIAVLERAAVSWRTARVLGGNWKDLRLLAGIPKIAAAAAAAALAAYGVKLLLSAAPLIVVLAVCGAVFAILYGGILLACRLLSADEMQMLASRIGPVWRRLKGGS